MQQDDERLITTSMREQEDETEVTLRPRTLAEYYGQTQVKEMLSVFIQAAVKRHEPLDHLLLYGPPGLGKTTLACIIASEMGQNIRTTSGPAIERPGDLASILTNLNQGDILFIDEIHRLSHSVEEVLYPAMEDFALDIMIGKGPSARSLRLDLPKFTLIGATTRAGMLSSPLRDRFGISFRLELYKPEELATIVMRSAKILKIECEPEGALEIARRSRGTPRISNRLIKRVRDFAQVRGDGVITREAAADALNILEIDELGLDKTDRAMLSSTKFSMSVSNRLSPCAAISPSLPSHPAPGDGSPFCLGLTALSSNPFRYISQRAASLYFSTSFRAPNRHENNLVLLLLSDIAPFSLAAVNSVPVEASFTCQNGLSGWNR